MYSVIIDSLHNIHGNTFGKVSTLLIPGLSNLLNGFQCAYDLPF